MHPPRKAGQPTWRPRLSSSGGDRRLPSVSSASDTAARGASTSDPTGPAPAGCGCITGMSNQSAPAASSSHCGACRQLGGVQGVRSSKGRPQAGAGRPATQRTGQAGR